jgi:hypothetical protein
MVEELGFLVLRVGACPRLLLARGGCVTPSVAGLEGAVLFCARALPVSRLIASVSDVISAITTSLSISEMPHLTPRDQGHLQVMPRDLSVP